MDKVVIVNAFRTPTGAIMGKLSALTAPQLGAKVIEESLKRSGLEPSRIDEVIMGNVVSAGIGQNPARQAALFAGLPDTVASFTVNKVCASGLKAVSLGVQAIKLGDAEIVMAGGMESMSNTPFILKEMRRGRKLGDSLTIDSLVFDGLWDCYNNAHMGTLCELTADKFKISREEQDNFAWDSHKKAMETSKSGMFNDEIVPIKVNIGKEDAVVDSDESIRWDTSLEKLAKLKPAFKEDGGTITAGNAPGLNDGASVLFLMSKKMAKNLKLNPVAEIIGYNTGHVDPKWYTIAPVKAIENLLKKTGLEIDDFDLMEINEAFAAQALAVIKELSIDPAKVNVNGGAIALGHPIGSSGARILVTLIHALRHNKKRLGLASLCLGGGGGMCLAVRAL